MISRKLHAGLPPLPPRIKRLPISPAGFPVPWFVQWYKDGKAVRDADGEPDFRVANQDKLHAAVKFGKCWVCGQPTGKFKAFVIGPMCAINRTISEPPSHRECAIFSATACPFLSKPRMRRNEVGLPEKREPAAGFGIDRNPGVACVWITLSYKVERAHAGNEGVLFALGDPIEVLWFAQGREATRSEVIASIESGMPFLEKVAAMQEGGLEALALYKARAMPLLPAQHPEGCPR
jgi:hypothetical protein